MYDSAAEGESGASETEVAVLSVKVRALEKRGEDMTKARQHIKMANYYLAKDRPEKADRQIEKAKAIIGNLDGSLSEAEMSPNGGELDIQRQPQGPPPPPPSTLQHAYTRWPEEGDKE
jgi:hypothetical protein